MTVTGVVSNAKMHNMKEDAKEMAKDSGIKKSDSEHGHLKATDVKMVKRFVQVSDHQAGSHRLIQRQFCDQLFQAHILFLHLPQLTNLVHLQPNKLFLPAIKVCSEIPA